MTYSDPLRLLTDETVDSFFAEPVQLRPWRTDGAPGYGGGYLGSGVDSARAVIDTFGIQVTPGTDVVGEGSGFATMTVLADVWISISEERMIDIANWQKGDRVWLEERSELFELLYVSPSATRRRNIALLRIKDSE